jgi:hypothetical protein
MRCYTNNNKSLPLFLYLPNTQIFILLAETISQLPFYIQYQHTFYCISKYDCEAKFDSQKRRCTTQ